MILAIRHVTEYRYTPPVQRLTLRLRLIPATTTAQRIGRWSVSVNGVASEPIFVNAHGDAEGLATVAGPVEAVEIVAEGTVETTDRTGVVEGLRCAVPPGAYLRATKATRADAAIAALAGAHRSDDGPLATAHALSAAVSEAIDYVPGRTGMATSAAEALAAGKGVCQDMAHVLIAAARTLEMPARYVAGYLNGAPDAAAGEPAVLATHGWAEIHIDGIGWVGFDPSNRLCPTDDYVRLSSGLDALDAAPVRGSIQGGAGEEALSATVTVTAAQGQSQKQQ